MSKFIISILVGLSISFTLGNAQNNDLKVEYLFSIGEDIEFGEPGYLHNPRSAATDSKGNIFISDHVGRLIQMYSPEGEYIKSFGGQGRGPGEFNRITEIAIDENDRLLVLDRFQFKVSRFDVESGDIEEHLFEDMPQINMMTLTALKNELFAGFYVESGPQMNPNKETKAIRIYQFGDGEMKSSVFEIFRHQFDLEIPIEKNFGAGIGHVLGRISGSELVAGHQVYSGVHYLVDSKSGEVRKIYNDELEQEAYHMMDPDDRPAEVEDRFAGSITASGGADGPFYYQVLQSSMLYAGFDEKLFHVYRLNQKEGYEFSDYIEIFSDSGELSAHQSIFDLISLPEDVQFRTYLHLDQKGRLFVSDRYELDDPKVSVYQISIGD